MARSSWKFVPITRFYLTLTYQVNLLKSLNFLKKKSLIDENIISQRIVRFHKNLRRKVDARYLTITQNFSKISLRVHKGFMYQKVYINNFLVGRKLGEFSMTRKPFKYPFKKKKKNFIRR